MIDVKGIVRNRVWCAIIGAAIGVALLSIYRVSNWLLGDFGVLYAFVVLVLASIGFLVGPVIRRDVCDERSDG